MSLVRPTRPSNRPSLWTKPDFVTWNQNDVTTSFTLTIYDNEEKTKHHNLIGEELWIVISNDYVGSAQWDSEAKFTITKAAKGEVSVRMPADAVSRIGEFKVEAYIFDGTNRLFTHHEDFDVI